MDPATIADQIAQAVAGTRYVAGRTVVEHTRLIAFDVAREAALRALAWRGPVEQ